jgi:hypothetical protein
MRVAFLVFALTCTGCYGTSGDGGDDDSGAGARGGSGSGASGGSAATGGSGGIVSDCAEETYSLEGTINGQPLTYAGALDGHAWIQGGDLSTLDTPFLEGGSFHAEWAGFVAEGGSTECAGFTELPPGGTRAGETLNFGSGTLNKFGATVTFELGDLSEEVTCDMAPCPDELIEGEIHGCVRWTER